MTKTGTARFLKARAGIERKRNDPQNLSGYQLGKQRKERVGAVLQELKEDGVIRHFVSTGSLSFGNITKGIDFFVVYVGNTSYKVCPLSVTGERWVDKHKARHPEIPVITVDFLETSASLKQKILEAIKNN